MTPRHTRVLARHDGYAAPPSAIEIAYARCEAAPITLDPIDHACDPTCPAWILASIEEAAGRLGAPSAWRWQAGEQRGAVLHFELGGRGHHEYAVGIQAGDAVATWAETPFAASESGITAALEQHLGT